MWGNGTKVRVGTEPVPIFIGGKVVGDEVRIVVSFQELRMLQNGLKKRLGVRGALPSLALPATELV